VRKQENEESKEELSAAKRQASPYRLKLFCFQLLSLIWCCLI